MQAIKQTKNIKGNRDCPYALEKMREIKIALYNIDELENKQRVIEL